MDLEGVPKKMYTHYIHLYKNLLYHASKNNFKMLSFAFRKMVHLPLSFDVKTCLDKNMQNRWFERRGTVECPLNAPDGKPMNFFV